MSKFFLAKQNLSSPCESILNASGLIPASRFDTDGMVARSYFKRNLKNENFYQSGADWIVGCGTYVVNGKTGAAGLQEILQQFNEGNIRLVQDAAWGHYAFCICNNNVIYVVGDGLGTLDLFYAKNEKGDFIVSNDIRVVTPVFDRVKLDHDMAYVEFACYSTGTNSLLHGVNRLVSSAQYIRVENGKMNVKEFNDDHLRIKRDNEKEVSLEQALESFGKLSQHYFGQLKAFDKTGINFTGGLDGRLILSVIRKMNIPVGLYHGIGNSYLVNTQPNDLKIAQQVADDLALPLHLMNWNNDESERNEDHDRANFMRHGLLAHIFGGSHQFESAMIERNRQHEAIVFLGGFCPAFSNKEFHEKVFTSIEAIAGDCLKGPLSSISFRRYNKVVSALRKEFETFFRLNNLLDDQGNITVDGDIARALAYVRAESEHLNMYNEYDYYLAPFNTLQLLLPLLKVPLSYRKNRVFQVRMVQLMDEKLMQYPLFSGIMFRNVDEAKGEVAPTAEVQKPVAQKERSRMLDGLRYMYYQRRSPQPFKYKGLDDILYRSVQEKLKSSPVNVDWRGWQLLNIRQSRRLFFISNVANFINAKK